MAALLPSTEHPTQTPDNSSQTGNPVVDVQNTILKAFNDYKFFLDAHTLKSHISKPTYEVCNEGPEHAPRYRATVLVCEKRYTSHTTFTQRKAAKMDAAKIAWGDIAPKTDDVVHVEKLLEIEEYALLCKPILSVFATKMHFGKPTFKTFRPDKLVRSFKSVVTFNGKSYTGEPAKQKREAERLAARAAILSLLGIETLSHKDKPETLESSVAALLPSTKHSTQTPDNSSQTGNSVVETQTFNDYKFFLDDLTQKANILKPAYEVCNEGPEHTPRYRAIVLVCGKRYTSHTTFTQQRIAEQDAARVALDCIPPNALDNIAQKTDDVEKLLDIEEYALLCKSILNVFAMRMHFHKPTYNAIHIHPNVKSVVSFNGKNYTGEPAKHKKKADQLAAHAAILSLLESKLKDALLNTIISEAEQVFAKLNDVGEDDSMINAIESLLSGSKTVSSAPAADLPCHDTGKGVLKNNDDGSSQPGLVQVSSAQVMIPANHEINKPVVQSSTVSVALPKSLRVPPSVQQYIRYVH